MSRRSIHTTLVVPTALAVPSPNSLQWTSGGQIIFMTKNDVYILTPDLGIGIATPSFKTISGAVQSPSGWFRTMIQPEKGDPRNWAEISQEWGTISLGSLDVTLRAIASSPHNVTRGAGCVVATLDSNMECILWAASKNLLSGKWDKVANVTEFMLTLASQDDLGLNTSATLQAQVMCIAWSSQPDFGVMPAPQVDRSMLIAGTRAGSLTFLTYMSRSLTHVGTIKVADEWITNITISEWERVGPVECRAFVAFSVADGSVSYIEISQALRTRVNAPSFEMDDEFTVKIEKTPHIVAAADKRVISGLVWIAPQAAIPILVYCKPGIVHLWSRPGTSSWSGSRSLLLFTHGSCPVSSPFAPVSGIAYSRRRDALILSLFDGTFHVIYGVSHDPSWSAQDDTTTNNHSAVARTILNQVDPGSVLVNDLVRISGMSSYDGDSIVTWVHELCRPQDLNYKHDAMHSSMFVTARLWQDTFGDFHLQELSRILASAKAARGDAPIHLLRPFFVHLQDSTTMSSYHVPLMEILRFSDSAAPIAINAIGSPTFDVPVSRLRSHFRHSLAQHLFGSDFLLSLRLKLAVADYCWKLSEDKEKQAECGEAARTLLIAISLNFLGILYRHLIAVLDAVTSDDIPFAQRMLHQLSRINHNADLAADAEALSAALLAKFPGLTNGSDELCPACLVPIPFQSDANATCANGHCWARCSATSFILSTPAVRTCIGCARKAFLPPSQGDIPVASKGWVVKEFLEAVNYCLFCGNDYVPIL